MGFKDTWRRSLEYFGLVEGDYIEEGEYVEGDTGQEMALDPETAVSPREAPARTMRAPSRRREDDIDDIFGDEEPAQRRGGGRLRSVEAPRRGRRDEPDPAPMRGNGGSDFSMHVVTPRSFNDAQQVADEFKARKPVIINLQNSDRELSKRL